MPNTARMSIGFLSLKAGTAAGGLATYEQHLVGALASIDRHNRYHIFCVHPVEPSSFGVDAPNFTFHRVYPRNRLAAMAWSAPRAIARAGVDLVHVPFIPPLLMGQPFVFTAHGPEMFVDPGFFPLRIRLSLIPLTKFAYRHASEIVCASGTTRAYLVEHFPGTRDRARVVYNGCDERFRPMDPELARRRVRELFGIDGPYVLAVGRVEPRKNPIRLLEAFAIFSRNAGKDVRLVIAGNKTWSAAEAQAAIVRLGIGPRVKLLGFVDYADLPALYAAAEMFVFPSLWEGFGLPLIEAMRCGTPTVTSQTSCLPEVAGGASELVDPMSSESIAAGMMRVWTDAALRERLRIAGLARGMEFTWERTARETLEAYADVWRRARAPMPPLGA